MVAIVKRKMRKITTFLCAVTLLASLLCYGNPEQSNSRSALVARRISFFMKGQFAAIMLGAFFGYIDMRENTNKAAVLIALGQFLFAQEYLDH